MDMMRLLSTVDHINLLKCKNSQVCLHFGQICDKVKDCPLGNDENLCTLQDITCPLLCQCLAFAIFCHNVNFIVKPEIKMLPYQMVDFKYSNEYFIKDILRVLKHARVIIVNANNIKAICSYLPILDNSLLIDIGYNKIKKLDSFCFSHLPNIRVINVNDNDLSKICPHSFLNLSTLVVLDLSNNKLHTFREDMITQTNSIKLLVLVNNSFSDIKQGAFQDFKSKFVSTNDSRVCCVVQANILCTADSEHKPSCSL